MSLILTYINRFGILHASDSNLSAPGQAVVEGKKVFPIDFLCAGLSVAGTYSVDGKEMHNWMEEFINEQKDNNISTLKEFTEILKYKLQGSLRKNEFKAGCMMQISGYSETKGIIHPELWFLRNVHSINMETGQYENIDETIEISEDFASRDLLNNTTLENYNLKEHETDYSYFNGFAPGRISYYYLSNSLDDFFKNVWSNEKWKFRPPSNLNDYKLLANSYMVTIDALFQLSDDYGRVIGGTPQFHLIPAPN
ncbi:MAG TPA: hypothetical protein PKC72_13795 [Chitinophagaceae bacterium]|nr:hypothetical protein [Chitinophagaceae bacterium]